MYVGRPNLRVIPAKAGVHVSEANAFKRQASDLRSAFSTYLPQITKKP